MIDARGGVISPIAAEIEQAAPESCLGCFTVGSSAMKLATEVHAGTVTMDEAKQSLNEEISGRCGVGPVDKSIIGGYISIVANPECSYR